MVGPSNESNIKVCGKETICLIDSGSMVTTVSEQFYNSLQNKPDLHDITEFQLDVYGANGGTLPYIGYIEAKIEVPHMNEPLYIPALVTKVSDVNTRVPVIIGTNVIRFCKDLANTGNEAWQSAIQSMGMNCVPVKSSNRFPIKVGPSEVKYVKGIVRNISNQPVLTEQAENGQQGLIVCPRLLSVRSMGKTKAVTVKVCNISTNSVKILPKTNICNVSQVQIVDSWNPESMSADKKHWAPLSRSRVQM